MSTVTYDSTSGVLCPRRKHLIVIPQDALPWKHASRANTQHHDDQYSGGESPITVYFADSNILSQRRNDQMASERGSSQPRLGSGLKLATVKMPWRLLPRSIMEQTTAEPFYDTITIHKTMHAPCFRVSASSARKQSFRAPNPLNPLIVGKTGPELL